MNIDKIHGRGMLSILPNKINSTWAWFINYELKFICELADDVIFAN